MLQRVRKHLSFANVTALIALFVALGTGAYAANTINSRDVINNSLRNKDMKRNTLRGNKIREGTLRGVDRCPATAPSRVAGVCYGAERTPTNWDTAAQQVCDAAGLRLPTIGEALLIMNQVGGGSANETWTDEVTELPPDENTRGLVTADPASQIFAAPVGSNHEFRCVTDATN